MTDAPDTELLAEFVRTDSETAFAALVERHIGLVHSVALRHTTQPQHAQDITQAVFIILAKKADKLSKHIVLPGWLYNTARLTAANFQRTEARRIRREQEAYMQSTLEETAPENLWHEMSPLLDEAMAHLSATDRDALVLRYFQNKTLPEVGAALGLEERAAQKRVTRAVEKLRKIFAQRGVALTATAIAGAVSTNSVQAAPVALAKTISIVAVAKGAAATTSTLTLVKGTLKLMAWTKIKMAVVAGVIVLLAASGGTAVFETINGATPVKMAGPVDMRIKWTVGKKYSMHMEFSQGTETKIPNQPQPVKSAVNSAQDFDISALKELANGGWLLQLQFVNETLEVMQAGNKILSYDSTKNSPVDPNSPVALLRMIIDARLQYFTDANGKVEKVEGVDDLQHRVAAAGKPQGQGEVLFNELFGPDRLKQNASLGDSMPNRVVKVGERWSVQKNIASAAVGPVAVDLQFNFKNWEMHGSHQCAHVEMAGDLSTKNISTATGAAISIEKGKISGDFWFDPQLGMIVETDSEQVLTLKMSTQAQTMTPQVTTKARLSLVDIQ